MQRSITSTPDQASGRRGFTIVELLVVIVIIGILATIVIVAYNGIQQRAHVAALQSDVSNSASTLELANAQNNVYPANLTSAALKASPGTTYQYTYTSSGNTYCLTGTNSAVSYFVSTTNPTPQSGACPGDVNGGVATLTCPSGFIVVPGSTTYGTSDFCVMKYEAKQASSTVPASQASGSPWVNISQTDAITYSANVAGCTGCHLITEPEFMTIAQNVLSVASNWSGGTVGSGYIYSGHNDNSPANALSADSNDANGYAGETNTGGNQRRTLTLTNGEVIWDLAGNVWHWTSGTSTTGQPGITGEGGYAWKEWTGVTAIGMLMPSASPTGTGLTGASSWNSSKGVGQLYSYSGETAVRGFLRGGYWSLGGPTGVLTLSLNYAPGTTLAYLGFRVSR